MAKECWGLDSVGAWHLKLQQTGLPVAIPAMRSPSQNVCVAMKLLCIPQKEAVC